MRRRSEPAAAGVDHENTVPAGEAGAPPASVFRYPLRERFVWREWAVPFALAIAVTIIIIARALLSPVAVELGVPVSESPGDARSVQQAAPPVDAPSTPDQPAEEPVAAPGLRVVLRCEGTTWAEATPDGGAQRRYELGPGQNLELAARERLTLSLGDAGVVRISVNQRELGFIGYKGETKTGLSFSAAAATNPPPVAAPRGMAGD